MISIASTTELREALHALALDLAFVSSPEAGELFRRLDPAATERVGRNPVAIVADLPDSVLEEALANGLAAEVAGFESERAAGTHSWWTRDHPGHSLRVAYFSMEFGLHESLPIYSGGLGVLAGDHLKAASALGIPLVGVGLLYRKGYFRQSLARDGTQAETYEATDRHRLPLTLERDENGVPRSVEVMLGDESLAAWIWRAEVGAVRLYLLDSDVEGNSREARRVTDVLYGGDREHRLRQEVLLGLGGVRALRALGLQPTVFHVNEGHSAFLVLERLRALVEEDGLDLDDALERVRLSTVFTTHTPVPAGNEIFPAQLVLRYLGTLARGCGMSGADLIALGSTTGNGESFGMTELALRTSARANAVSALHGTVSRKMWSVLWPDRPPEEAPISHVTNGVHAPTWTSGEFAGLLRSAGVGLEAAPSEARWERAGTVDEGTLWEIHRRRKDVLLASLPQGGLDPGALTIGFARRFAAYKRAWLLFSEPERLLRVLSDPDRPVQVVLAGKAHPGDDQGKAILAELVRFARDPRAGGRVVFVENYDMSIAKLLVQGVDLWLTTPRRPNEASGTSGMKAGLNGVLNLSVLDGWWPEAYSPEIGWAIGERISAQGDEAEAGELLRVLEEEVLPAYFDRDENGVPPRWVAMMKASIARIGGRFHAERMVVEYVEHSYLPAHEAAATRV
jgi:starch phosphorylase